MNGDWSLAMETRKEHGVFGDYEVHGVKLESEDGESAWRIDIWRSGQNPVKHYCAMENIIFPVKLVLTNDPDYPMAWQKDKQNTEIDGEEKGAIVDALRRWGSRVA